ncbi:MAG: helix-turn-helix transcriptional regulator [Thermoleophilaceae bacterium]
MDTPATHPDDPLAQPTRARLFSFLGELKQPAQTEELAEHVGLHINGVRVHLERLRVAGLVTRTRVRQAIGRPRDEWAIAPDARPGGNSPSAYADLGRWLARAIQPTKAQLRDIEATGREIGRELAPRGSRAPNDDAMQTTLTAMGFKPHRSNAPAPRAVYMLGNCPYRDAVRQSQPVVCTLHRGLTRGLLDVLEPTAHLADFVPRDPDTAGCLIEIEGVATSAEV